jgi:hypothetical protein
LDLPVSLVVGIKPPQVLGAITCGGSLAAVIVVVRLLVEFYYGRHRLLHVPVGSGVVPCSLAHVQHVVRAQVGSDGVHNPVVT